MVVFGIGAVGFIVAIAVYEGGVIVVVFEKVVLVGGIMVWLGG